MRYAKFIIIVLICIISTGCLVPSINPFYKTDNLVYDNSLTGTWVDPDEQESLWTFKKSGPLSYTLYTTENNELTSFEAHLFNIQNLSFIDLYPMESYTKSDFYNSHLIPAHTVYSVVLDGDKLIVHELNYEWFSRQAKDGKIKIEYFQNDDMYFLTDKTEYLQQFILQNYNDCFGGEEIVLVKLR